MTAVETFANQPTTTVSSGGTTAPSPGATETWLVASSASFPAANSGATPPTQFHVADVATGKTGEIIAVTNISGTTWTVTRGAESTTPVAHTAGFTIVQVVSAGAYGGMLQSGNNLSDVASVSTARSNLSLLADFAPTGLTGATAASRYVGGTTTGAPVTGTFAVGDYVIAQDGKAWICTTAGSPGTWAQAGAALDTNAADIQPLGVPAAGTVGKGADAGHVHPWQPFQFLVKNYGAKGDGILLTDVSITASSAVLTSAGLSAPSAPTLAHAGTGGTVAAGTYQVKVTLVNQYGETTASSSASVTTTGSTSTITIDSPAGAGNAYFWYAYVTQAGGSTYTRQQPAGSPAILGTNLVLTAPPTSSGANPPGANTTAALFSAADVGKHIFVNNAGPNPASDTSGGLFTTIASWSSGSPNSVTLAATASNTVSDMTAMYGTDDTAAIQAAMNALITYDGFWGQPYMAELLFDPGIYVLASMPVPGGNLPSGLTYGNAQIPLPVVDLTTTQRKPTIVIRSTNSDNSTLDFWQQTIPQIQGTCLFSMLEITNANHLDATYGPVSVIGGPQDMSPFANNICNNVLVVIDAIQVVCPPNPGQIALDFAYMAQFAVKTASLDVLASPAGNPALKWQGAYPQNPNGMGLRVPLTGFNDRCDVWSLTVEGYYTGMSVDEHVAMNRVAVIYANQGLFVNAWGGNQASHGCWIGYASLEQCKYPLYAGNAAGSLFGLVIENLDNEGNVTEHIHDPSNYLSGHVNIMPSQSASLPVPVIVNGASNLEVLTIGTQSPQRGPVSAPTMSTSATAFQNPFWRHASVNVQPGTASVSAIAVDGTVMTGVTAGTVRVPSGHDITVTYSGGVPTWQWVLD